MAAGAADCWISMCVPGQVSCIKNQQFTVKLQKETTKKPKPFPSPFLVEGDERQGGILGMSCVGPEAGLSDPDGHLPTQLTPWFCDTSGCPSTSRSPRIWAAQAVAQVWLFLEASVVSLIVHLASARGC